MLDELCSEQTCVNCRRLIERKCPLIEFVLLQLKMYERLSCDELLSDLGRKIARETADALKGFLMMRGIFIEQ